MATASVMVAYLVLLQSNLALPHADCSQVLQISSKMHQPIVFVDADALQAALYCSTPQSNKSCSLMHL